MTSSIFSSGFFLLSAFVFASSFIHNQGSKVRPKHVNLSSKSVLNVGQINANQGSKVCPKQMNMSSKSVFNVGRINANQRNKFQPKHINPNGVLKAGRTHAKFRQNDVQHAQTTVGAERSTSGRQNHFGAVFFISISVLQSLFLVRVFCTHGFS